MTYLLVNIGAFVLPFIFTFHKKLNFYSKWKFFWPASFISLVLFGAWDILYTSLGVWEFNPAHLLGVYVFNLPIEEWMFFICIPYASVFTYHCLNVLIKKDFLKLFGSKISGVLVVLMVVMGIISWPKLYSAVTFLLLAITIVLFQWVFKVKWLSRFYFSYTILLLPFFVVNGILTGWGLSEPVVIYNEMENLNIRWNTIPIEDVFYGMLLMLSNIGFYEYFQSR